MKGDKAVVVGVDPERALALEILSLRTGDVARDVEEKRLDKVLPKAGSRVMVVRGRPRGRTGLLRRVEMTEGKEAVEVAFDDGRVAVLGVDDVCKYEEVD